MHLLQSNSPRGSHRKFNVGHSQAGGRRRRHFHRPRAARWRNRRDRHGQAVDHPGRSEHCNHRGHAAPAEETRQVAGRSRSLHPRDDARHQHADRAQGRGNRPHHDARLSRHHRDGHRNALRHLRSGHRPAAAAGAARDAPRSDRAHGCGGRRSHPARSRGSACRGGRIGRRRRRRDRRVPAAFLYQSAPRAGDRRADTPRISGNCRVAVVRDPARDPRIRARIDDGRERLCAAGHRASSRLAHARAATAWVSADVFTSCCRAAASRTSTWRRVSP